MSVEYRAALGYGLIVDPKDVSDPDEVGVWEILENVLDNLPLITYESGGGGYSNTEERYALLIRSTVQSLDEVDGVIALERPHISLHAQNQLYAAYHEVVNTAAEPAAAWLVAGGWY